jgi:hypothetical protein
MTEKRNVRADETRSSMRDEETRPETAWKPPALLDAPEPVQGMSKGGLQPRFRGKIRQTTYTSVCVKDGKPVLLIL